VFDTSQGTQRIVDELGVLAEGGFQAALGKVEDIWNAGVVERIGGT
jgi:hypothetical protein